MNRRRRRQAAGPSTSSSIQSWTRVWMNDLEKLVVNYLEGKGYRVKELGKLGILLENGHTVDITLHGGSGRALGPIEIYYFDADDNNITVLSQGVDAPMDSVARNIVEHYDRKGPVASRAARSHRRRNAGREFGYKGKLPPDISNEMDLWREGFGSIEGYIDYHEEKAREVLRDIARKYDLDVRRTYMDGDGWMDGMRVLHAEVETPSGRILPLVWKDSHGSGHWMDDSGAGSSALSEKALR